MSDKQSESTISEIIDMAWCDKTSFDDILTITGLSEHEVINIMRLNLKPNSFKLWRKRVTGRKAKHSVKYQNSDSQNNDSQNNDSQNNDSQNNDSQNNDSQNNDSQNNDSQNNDSQNNDSQNTKQNTHSGDNEA